MTARPSEQPVPTCSRQASSSSRAAEDAHGLPPDSYTAQRLENASHEHLHVTSRRFFIGPLPRGWIQRHRRSWYKAFFGFKNYSSRVPTFSALDISLGRSSAPGLNHQSFPQPEDVDFEDVSEEEEGREEQGEGGNDTRGEGNASQVDGGVAATTAATRGITTQPIQAEQGQPKTDSSQEPARLRHDTKQEKKEESQGISKRVSFPDESGPSLRPSSSHDVRETYYTPPESKPQTDGFPGISTPSSTVSSAPDGPQSRRPAAAPKSSSSLPGPSVSVVPEVPESEENLSLAPPSNGTAPTLSDVGSQASLLPHGSRDAAAAAAEAAERPEPSAGDLQEEEPRAEEDHDLEQGPEQAQDTVRRGESTESEENVGKRLESRVLSRITSFRFGVEDNLMDRRRRLSTRFSRGQQPQDPAAQREQQLSECREGEIVRAERMLVKLDVTEQSVPDEFSENESLKIESRPIEKWREYLVVCRRGSNEATAPALLQLFKTRVTPQVRGPQVKKRCSHEILLARGRTKANLFSGLDKTIVLWHPYKQQQTRIVILRAASGAHSVEWYTFIRDTLGRKQPSTLMVYVPDLGVSLRLKNPFVLLAAAQKRSQEESQQEGCREGGGCADDGGGDRGTTANAEQSLAPAIVNTCLNTLQECPQFATVLDLWTRSEKMGLAWRRYDRLEWVQGANEQRMYGMQSMLNSHELELRPRQHYPTVTESATVGDHPTPMHEPPPVEGFMILLTSQRGASRRWGKMFYRRLYFYTEDQYLCFCKPAKAKPPVPPRIATICGERVPRTSNVARESPLVYPVEPFPLEGGKIPWLNVDSGRRKAYIRRRDAEAYAEARRNVANLTQAEGYISLCRISDVRPARPSSSCSGRRASTGHTDHTDRTGSSNRHEETEHSNGGDMDFHGETAAGRRANNNNNAVDSRTGPAGVGGGAHRILSGSATRPQVKSSRTLELVLDDGLVVQLRTYNQETRDEWVKRLREMMAYWKARTRDDTLKLKAVRQRNLDRLEIDEEQESMLGQMAQKWEVSKAEASPELFNTCGLSGCRAIKMSGQLYRKTRRRAPFVKISVVLMEGRLLIFQGSVRKSSGAQRQHTHHERKSMVDLNDCYVYSGILTSSDQLYQGQKPFGNRLPGHYSTPRIYLSDGWTSTDEDTATCFVIWRGAGKSLFRGDGDGDGDEEAAAARGGKAKIKWRQVRALGVPGKSIVFKTRSRAERDLWVLAIQTEIDRMQHEEDLRLVRKA